MLVGLRGVGKTVLLNKVEEIAETSGYIPSLVETPETKSLPELIVPSLRNLDWGRPAAASRVGREGKILR